MVLEEICLIGYGKGHKQRIFMNSPLSSWSEAISSVPLGLVLSPLSFNDLPSLFYL